MTKSRNGSEWNEDSLCKHYVRKPFSSELYMIIGSLNPVMNRRGRL